MKRLASLFIGLVCFAAPAAAQPAAWSIQLIGVPSTPPPFFAELKGLDDRGQTLVLIQHLGGGVGEAYVQFAIEGTNSKLGDIGLPFPTDGLAFPPSGGVLAWSASRRAVQAAPMLSATFQDLETTASLRSEISGELRNAALLSGRFPEGTYTITAWLTTKPNGEGDVLAETSTSFSISLPQPPQPVSPEREAVVTTLLPTFSWEPVVASFPLGQVVYGVRLYRILGDTSPEQAVRSAPAPWAEAEVLDLTTYTPPTKLDLDDGQRYAWTVGAARGDGEDLFPDDADETVEIFSFTYRDPEREALVRLGSPRQEPYAKLRAGERMDVRFSLDPSYDPALWQRAEVQVLRAWNDDLEPLAWFDELRDEATWQATLAKGDGPASATQRVSATLVEGGGKVQQSASVQIPEVEGKPQALAWRVVAVRADGQPFASEPALAVVASSQRPALALEPAPSGAQPLDAVSVGYRATPPGRWPSVTVQAVAVPVRDGRDADAVERDVIAGFDKLFGGKSDWPGLVVLEEKDETPLDGAYALALPATDGSGAVWDEVVVAYRVTGKPSGARRITTGALAARASASVKPILRIETPGVLPSVVSLGGVLLELGDDFDEARGKGSARLLAQGPLAALAGAVEPGAMPRVALGGVARDEAEPGRLAEGSAAMKRPLVFPIPLDGGSETLAAALFAPRLDADSSANADVLGQALVVGVPMRNFDGSSDLLWSAIFDLGGDLRRAYRALVAVTGRDDLVPFVVPATSARASVGAMPEAVRLAVLSNLGPDALAAARETFRPVLTISRGQAALANAEVGVPLALPLLGGERVQVDGVAFAPGGFFLDGTTMLGLGEDAVEATFAGVRIEGGEPVAGTLGVADGLAFDIPVQGLPAWRAAPQTALQPENTLRLAPVGGLTLDYGAGESDKDGPPRGTAAPGVGWSASLRYAGRSYDAMLGVPEPGLEITTRPLALAGGALTFADGAVPRARLRPLGVQVLGDDFCQLSQIAQVFGLPSSAVAYLLLEDGGTTYADVQALGEGRARLATVGPGGAPLVIPGLPREAQIPVTFALDVDLCDLQIEGGEISALSSFGGLDLTPFGLPFTITGVRFDPDLGLAFDGEFDFFGLDAPGLHTLTLDGTGRLTGSFGGDLPDLRLPLLPGFDGLGLDLTGFSADIDIQLPWSAPRWTFAFDGALDWGGGGDLALGEPWRLAWPGGALRWTPTGFGGLDLGALDFGTLGAPSVDFRLPGLDLSMGNLTFRLEGLGGPGFDFGALDFTAPGFGFGDGSGFDFGGDGSPWRFTLGGDLGLTLRGFGSPEFGGFDFGALDFGGLDLSGFDGWDSERGGFRLPTIPAVRLGDFGLEMPRFDAISLDLPPFSLPAGGGANFAFDLEGVRLPSGFTWQPGGGPSGFDLSALTFDLRFGLPDWPGMPEGLTLPNLVLQGASFGPGGFSATMPSLDFPHLGLGFPDLPTLELPGGLAFSLEGFRGGFDGFDFGDSDGSGFSFAFEGDLNLPEFPGLSGGFTLPDLTLGIGPGGAIHMPGVELPSLDLPAFDFGAFVLDLTPGSGLGAPSLDLDLSFDPSFDLPRLALSLPRVDLRLGDLAAGGPLTLDLLRFDITGGGFDLPTPFAFGWPPDLGFGGGDGSGESLFDFDLGAPGFSAFFGPGGLRFDGPGRLDLPGMPGGLGIDFDAWTLGIADLGISGGSVDFPDPFAFTIDLGGDGGSGLDWNLSAPGLGLGELGGPDFEGFTFDLPDIGFSLGEGGLSIPSGSGGGALRFGGVDFEGVTFDFDGVDFGFFPIGLTAGTITLRYDGLSIGTLTPRGFTPDYEALAAYGLAATLPDCIPLPDMETACLLVREDNEWLATYDLDSGALENAPGRTSRLLIFALEDDGDPSTPSADVSFERVRLAPRGSSFVVVEGTITATVAPEDPLYTKFEQRYGVPVFIERMQVRGEDQPEPSLSADALARFPGFLDGTRFAVRADFLAGGVVRAEAENAEAMDERRSFAGGEVVAGLTGVRLAFGTDRPSVLDLDGYLWTRALASAGEPTDADRLPFGAGYSGGAWAFDFSRAVQRFRGEGIALPFADFAPDGIIVCGTEARERCPGAPAIRLAALIDGRLDFGPLVDGLTVGVRDLRVGPDGVAMPEASVSLPRLRLFGGALQLRDLAATLRYERGVLTADLQRGSGTFWGETFTPPAFSVGSDGTLGGLENLLAGASLRPIPGALDITTLGLVTRREGGEDEQQLRVAGAVLLPAPLGADGRDRQAFDLYLRPDGRLGGSSNGLVTLFDDGGRRADGLGNDDSETTLPGDIFAAAADLRRVDLQVTAQQPALRFFADLYLDGTPLFAASPDPLLTATPRSLTWAALDLAEPGDLRFDLSALEFAITSIGTSGGRTFGLDLDLRGAFDLEGVGGGVTLAGLSVSPGGVRGGEFRDARFTLVDVFTVSAEDVDISDERVALLNPALELTGFGAEATMELFCYGACEPVDTTPTGMPVSVRDAASGTPSGLIMRGLGMTTGGVQIGGSFEYLTGRGTFLRFAGNAQLGDAAQFGVYGKFADWNDRLSFGLFASASAPVPLVPALVDLTGIRGGFVYNPDAADLRILSDVVGADYASIEPPSSRETPKLLVSLGGGLGILGAGGTYTLAGSALVTLTDRYLNVQGDIDQVLGTDFVTGTYGVTVGLRDLYLIGNATVDIDVASGAVTGGGGMDFFAFDEDTWGLSVDEVGVDLLGGLIDGSASLFIGDPGFFAQVNARAGFDAGPIGVNGSANGAAWINDTYGTGLYLDLNASASLIVEVGGRLESAMIVGARDFDYLFYAAGTIYGCLLDLCADATASVTVKDGSVRGRLGRDSEMDRILAGAKGQQEEIREEAESARAAMEQQLADSRRYLPSPEDIQERGARLQLANNDERWAFADQMVQNESRAGLGSGDLATFREVADRVVGGEDRPPYAPVETAGRTLETRLAALDASLGEATGALDIELQTIEVAVDESLRDAERIGNPVRAFAPPRLVGGELQGTVPADPLDEQKANAVRERVVALAQSVEADEAALRASMEAFDANLAALASALEAPRGLAASFGGALQAYDGYHLAQHTYLGDLRMWAGSMQYALAGSPGVHASLNGVTPSSSYKGWTFPSGLSYGSLTEDLADVFLVQWRDALRQISRARTDACARQFGLDANRPLDYFSANNGDTITACFYQWADGNLSSAAFDPLRSLIVGRIDLLERLSDDFEGDLAEEGIQTGTASEQDQYIRESASFYEGYERRWYATNHLLWNDLLSDGIAVYKQDMEREYDEQVVEHEQGRAELEQAQAAFTERMDAAYALTYDVLLGYRDLIARYQALRPRQFYEIAARVERFGELGDLGGDSSTEARDALAFADYLDQRLADIDASLEVPSVGALGTGVAAGAYGGGLALAISDRGSPGVVDFAVEMTRSDGGLPASGLRSLGGSIGRIGGAGLANANRALLHGGMDALSNAGTEAFAVRVRAQKASGAMAERGLRLQVTLPRTRFSASNQPLGPQDTQVGVVTIEPDTTPPARPTVDFAAESVQNTSRERVYFMAEANRVRFGARANDPESGVARYRYVVVEDRQPVSMSRGCVRGPLTSRFSQPPSNQTGEAGLASTWTRVGDWQESPRRDVFTASGLALRVGRYYRVALTVQNGDGLWSPVHLSKPFVVDVTAPPAPNLSAEAQRPLPSRSTYVSSSYRLPLGEPGVLPPAEPTYSLALNPPSVTFEALRPNEPGQYNACGLTLEYVVGAEPLTDATFAASGAVATTTSGAITIEDARARFSEPLVLSARVRDRAGNASAVQTLSVTPVDATRPTQPKVQAMFIHGQPGRLVAALVQESIEADRTSGLAGYQFAIGTSAGGRQVKDYPDGGTVDIAASAVARTGDALADFFIVELADLGLTEGASYWVSIRAVNTSGATSRPSASGPWVFDTTPPEEPTITISYQEDHERLRIRITGIEDPSGVAYVGYDAATTRSAARGGALEGRRDAPGSSQTFYHDGAVANGTSRYVRVVVVDERGQSRTVIRQFTRFDIPPMPRFDAPVGVPGG